jgi:hypothetical protein
VEILLLCFFTKLDIVHIEDVDISEVDFLPTYLLILYWTFRPVYHSTYVYIVYALVPALYTLKENQSYFQSQFHKVWARKKSAEKVGI